MDHSEKKVKTNKAAVHEFKRTKINSTKIAIFLPLCWKKTLFNMISNSSFVPGEWLMGFIQLKNTGDIIQREISRHSCISLLCCLDKRLHINACFCNLNNVYQWKATQLQGHFNYYRYVLEYITIRNWEDLKCVMWRKSSKLFHNIPAFVIPLWFLNLEWIWTEK